MLEKASARRNTKRTDSHTKTGGSKNEKEGGQRRSRRNGAMAAGTIAAAVAMTSAPSTPSATAAPAETAAVAVSTKKLLPSWNELIKGRPHQSDVLAYLKNVHNLELDSVGVKRQYDKLLEEQAARTAQA